MFKVEVCLPSIRHQLTVLKKNSEYTNPHDVQAIYHAVIKQSTYLSYPYLFAQLPS